MGKKEKQREVTTCATSWAAAETVANIVDILTEILLCLPAKSVIRFKSVSKHWLNLITDSNFSSEHTRRNPNSFSTALYSCDGNLYSLSQSNSSSHPALSFLKSVTVLDSRNGLLLCHDYNFIICNPTTRSYRRLSCRESWCRGGFFGFSSEDNIFLFFDPQKSPHFKVVEARFDSQRSCTIDIYQSESDTWEETITLNMPDEWGDLTRHKKSSWNGEIHWISEGSYHIWFDPNRNELKGIKLPFYPEIRRDSDIQFFGECDGRLFMIPTRERHSEVFRVYEMGSDYCSWVATCKVYLTGLMKDVPGLDVIFRTHWFRVMSIVKGCKKDDLSLVLSIGEKVFSYGLRSKTWHFLDDLPESQFHSGCDFKFPVIESLSPF